MEIIILIIIIIVSVINAKNRTTGRNEGETDEPVLRKGNIPNRRKQQTSAGVRDMEDAINSLKAKMIQKAKKEEGEAYQKQQQERRRAEEEERKRREAEEQRKRAIEQKKKQEELRRKQMEKEKKEKEEKAMMERFAVEGSGSQPTVNAAQKTTGASKVPPEQSDHFRVEDYLDPLTASFYPEVEDYLFPTIASFYPNVDVSSFSLQNSMDVLE